jgi:hypothetical protein
MILLFNQYSIIIIDGVRSQIIGIYNCGLIIITALICVKKNIQIFLKSAG